MRFRDTIGLALIAAAIAGCAVFRAADPGDPAARPITPSLSGPVVFPSSSQIFGDTLQSP